MHDGEVFLYLRVHYVAFFTSEITDGTYIRSKLKLYLVKCLKKPLLSAHGRDCIF